MAGGVELGINFEGFDGLAIVLGVMKDAVSGDDVEMAAHAMMRPVTGPGSVGYLVDEDKTLERAIAARFQNQGADAYTSTRWTPLVGEPLYLAHKLRKGGGTKVGTWYGSTFPLAETFKRGDPDHVEHVRRIGQHDVEFAFGSRRDYARPFHEGGREQPWDGIPTPPRPILPDGNRLAFFYAKAVQRMIVGRIQQAGGSAGAELRGIRVEPA